MPDLYIPNDFEDVGADLEKLQPVHREELTAYELILCFYDLIRATEQRGVPLQRIYEVLHQNELKIKFGTFRNYLNKIRVNKQKEARRLKRQKKRTYSNTSEPNNVTMLSQHRERNQDVQISEA